MLFEASPIARAIAATMSCSPIRLLDQHRVRAELEVAQEIAGDEHVRHETVAKNLSDRRDAAALAQLDIDDHQIRAAIPSRRHGGVRVDLHRDDDMAEILQHLREQRTDHGIVLDDQHPQRSHRLTSPPAPPS